MILEFDKSFEKSIDKIKDQKLFKRIAIIIETTEKAESISQIKNIKKLIGFSNYYRIKLGDYRIGFEKINESTIRFIIIEHRKEIYRKFP